MDTTAIDLMRTFYNTGKTWHQDIRRSMLEKLRQTVRAKEDAILAALSHDLGKSDIEAYTSELSFVYSEINHALRNLNRWMNPQKKKTPLFLLPGKSTLHPEPKGVVLILGPWNYPFLLVFAPLIGALTAGNCVVVKPSEMAPHTSQVIEDIITSTFEANHCCVFQGDKVVAEELCAQEWDHLFFTGGTQVGRAVMKTAARHLTPLTLELGGKNPCFILSDADISIAAERIVWGKFLNAGQTCLAPDILYAEKPIAAELTNEIKRALERFYGKNPEESPDYGRVLSTAHIERLADYLQNVDIVCGGNYNKQTRYFAPTVVTNIPADSPLLQNEIFGPILGIVAFTDLAEQIEQLQKKPKPLALYIFSKSTSAQKTLLQRLPSGSAAINDTLKQALSSYLPFGGIGESGMGQYHGKASFDCFTHYRSIYKTTYHGLRFFYPPYRVKLHFIKKYMQWFMR
jgi:aldehyde dehydrogenase (NAD+)